MKDKAVIQENGKDGRLQTYTDLDIIQAGREEEKELNQMQLIYNRWCVKGTGPIHLGHLQPASESRIMQVYYKGPCLSKGDRAAFNPVVLTRIERNGMVVVRRPPADNNSYLVQLRSANAAPSMHRRRKTLQSKSWPTTPSAA